MDLRATSLSAILTVALLSVGCLEDPANPVADTGVPGDHAVPTDTSADVAIATDTGTDTGTDIGTDSGNDTGTDAPALTDVVADAGTDTGTDAGMRDGGGDAGFFGPSRCAGGGFLICEDFEGDAGYDHAVWTPSMTNGTLAVETSRAARGSHALHIHTHAPAVDGGGAGANVGLHTVHGLPRTDNTYFGRAFVWLAAHAPTTHTTLFESGGRLPDAGLNVSERFSVAGMNLDASYDTSPRPPTTDYARRSATPMPLDRWACLEWEFKGDTNEVHYWLDGTELADMAVAPTRTPQWTAPPWTHINVGLQLYRADVRSDFDLWLDEVAIDAARVGCTR